MASAIVNQSVCSSVRYPAESEVGTPKPHTSVYEIVTSRILAELEKGQVPWRKPWHILPPANLVSKKPYRGINVFLLALAGYGSQYWLTYRQAQALSGNVRRGEHGTKIVFWKFDKFETETADGETEERKSAFLRYYTVFNLGQTEGLKALLALPPAFPIESAEAIVAGMPNPPAFEQDSRAAYIPSRDTITMPSRKAFEAQAEYYSTLFHELTHATGHAKRLGREGFDSPQKFASESYSREELIAEMGSAMLCGIAGIEQATISNSAAYLQSWIKRLKTDSRLVVSAASAAQKAADYIRGESAKEPPPCHQRGIPCKLIWRSLSLSRKSTGPSASRISSAWNAPRECSPRSASVPRLALGSFSARLVLAKAQWRLLWPQNYRPNCTRFPLKTEPHCCSAIAHQSVRESAPPSNSA